MTLNGDVILAAISQGSRSRRSKTGALCLGRGDPSSSFNYFFMWRAFGAGVPGARFSRLTRLSHYEKMGV